MGSESQNIHLPARPAVPTPDTCVAQVKREQALLRRAGKNACPTIFLCKERWDRHSCLSRKGGFEIRSYALLYVGSYTLNRCQRLREATLVPCHSESANRINDERLEICLSNPYNLHRWYDESEETPIKL